MTTVHPFNFLRPKEANDVIDSIADVRVNAFVRCGLTLLFVRQNIPAEAYSVVDIDLCYFVEVLKALGQKRRILLEILQGDPSILEWDIDELALSGKPDPSRPGGER